MNRQRYASFYMYILQKYGTLGYMYTSIGAGSWWMPNIIRDKVGCKYVSKQW